MQKKINLFIASSILSVNAFAGQFQQIVSEAISVEAASVNTIQANIAGDSIVLDPNATINVGDRIYIEVDGATFADQGYSLEISAGGAGTGNLAQFILVNESPDGSNRLEFRSASDLLPVTDFILSGSSIAGQAVNFDVAGQQAGGNVTLTARAIDEIGDFDTYGALELFQFANQFSANISKLANAIVDVDQSRLSFTTGTSNTIEVSYTSAPLTNGLLLDDNDTINITLNGDMSGISEIQVLTDAINRGSMTIDVDSNTATFVASASDAFAATSTILNVEVTGSSALATRSFTLESDVDFESELDKNLIASGTTAGSWTINGMQAKVSHLSLNASGFISWLKVINEGTEAADVSADILYTLADGTEGSVTGATLLTVDAGGIGTVSEASILNVIGNPTQLVDASLTVTVAGQTNLIHLTAEKKATNGRTSLPVYYNVNNRNWNQ